MAEAAFAGEVETCSVRVCVRVRPFNKKELTAASNGGKPPRCVVKMRDDNNVAIVEHVTDERGFTQEREREAFTFDECFWSLPREQAFCPGKPTADQKFVYERTGKLALQAALRGVNSTIFAYGQTGSGKSHSMLGSQEMPGISPQLCDELFDVILSDAYQVGKKCTVDCMFFEIYNEKCRDLFNKKGKGDEYDAVKIRQHPTKGVFVDGLVRRECTSAAQTKKLIERGTNERAMAETDMNATSSRSHAVFQIQITQLDALRGTQKVSTINLVDLAGSERVKASGVKGENLVEATKINQSLSTLRKVIDALIDNSQVKNKKLQRMVPFRESVLTFVLSDSLGGNSKTTMMSAISPHADNMEETLGTLRYALRAKAIVCNARVNEEKSAAMLDAMREEIMALQQKLLAGSPGSGSGGGAPSAEILEEIEMRQQEIKKMEANAEVMQRMLEDAAVKEAELKVTVAQQRKERFAAAFRSAFVMTGERKRHETAKVELEALTKANEDLTEELSLQRRTTHAQAAEIAELRKRVDSEAQRLGRELVDKEASNISLRKQLAILTEEAVFLRTQSAGLFAKVEAANAAKADAERHLQRLQEELLHAAGALEAAKHERRASEAALQQQVDEARQQAEEFRKRKDKYKQLHIESNAQAAARSTMLDAMRDDRQTFVSTIKSQQALVAEHAHTAARLSDERREAQLRAQELAQQVADRESALRGANDALREYQSAAAEFIFDRCASAQQQRFSPSPVRAAPIAVGGYRSVSPVTGSRAGSTRFSDPRRF